MNERQAWRISNAFALFLLLIIGFMWYLEDQSHNPNPQQLVDMASTESYLAQNWHNTSTEPPLYISTGVFLESVTFHTPEQVQISGYIWQTYQNGVHDGLTRGFLLPEATSVTGNSQQVYAHQSGDKEVVGWHVQAILRQKFDYFKYPLDHKTIAVQLLHPDFHRNVVLVPDLASYDSTKPGQIFGVDQQIRLGEWNLEESFYQYIPSNYDANFGIQNHIAQKEYPELTFNMVVERKFFNVIMKYLVPLFAVLALLFAIVMMTNADQEVIGLYDMKALKALRSCASLFFLVLVGHIHLRQLLANTPVVYLEYFYIMAYLIIIAVSLNIYLYTVKWSLEPTAIREKNALLAQLLFWPLVLGGYLGVTFVAFL